ncbi:MAG: hypothetical protein NZ876_04935, partial [Dehalococcoidia bacterium]|nr:hypothetical protein [Dehalococcoidia bacterium]
ARFSAMYGRVVGPASAEQQQVLEEIHRSYDMQQHGRGAGTQEAAVTGEFARNFGIFGSPSYCVDRLSALIEAGGDRVILRGSPLDPDDPDSHTSERFIQEVASALKD